MKKTLLIVLGILIVLAGVGYFAYPLLPFNQGNAALAGFQTEAARLGSISVTVGATGTVRPQQSANILWQTSGKVAAVRVETGQQVAADAVLSELDRTSLAQNIIQAQADLVNARNALDNAINNSEARANARLALIKAQQALDDAEKEAQSKLYQRASKETIDIARANLINANQALDNAENLWDQTRGAGEDSPVYAAGLSQYAKARQDQQRAEYNLRYVEALPDPLAVEEVYAKLDKAKAQLLAAKQDWERIKDGPNPDDILAAQVRVDAAQATLNQARLTAPFAGTITQVNTRAGDLVSAGKTAFRIDDLSRLLVDVEINEVDINQVAVGQAVHLTFDAIPGQEFQGVVTEIASVGTVASGTVNFTVTVEIRGPGEQIKPGMTAAANVTVNELAEALLVPSRAIRTVDGKRVLYVLRDERPAQVEVTLGASANSYSQITQGDLRPGELVIVNPPSTGIPIGPGQGGMGAGRMMGGGGR